MRLYALVLVAALIMAACGEVNRDTTPTDNEAIAGEADASPTAVAPTAPSFPTETIDGDSPMFPTFPPTPDIKSCQHAADHWIWFIQMWLDAIEDVPDSVIWDEGEARSPEYEEFSDQGVEWFDEVLAQANDLGCPDDELYLGMIERVDDLIANNTSAEEVIAYLERTADEVEASPTVTVVPSPTPAVTPPSTRVSTPEEVGRELVETLCKSCHTVAGTKANGKVAPELTDFASRPMIAGVLENNEENLRLWLAGPSSVKPGTSMPDLGLTPEQIDGLTAYLSTLN